MSGCNMIRSTIVAGLSCDRGTPEGDAKVEDVVTLMINYWTAFEVHGIEAAVKIAKEAAPWMHKA